MDSYQYMMSNGIIFWGTYFNPGGSNNKKVRGFIGPSISGKAFDAGHSVKESQPISEYVDDTETQCP